MRFRGFALESPRGISTAGRWSKALLAAALGLGTLGTTLALVDVAPASATGTPTITSIVTTSGPLAGGSANKITITGTNFEATADNTVDFGPGNPGTVHSESGGKTLVVYPPAATQYGPVQLTVTTTVSGGTSNAVTYTYAAAPTVGALYSANGPTTGGTTIIITGSNFVGPGAVTAVDFNTTAATSFTVNSNTNISAVVPVMPSADTAGKTYYVTVVTDSGTSAEGPGSAWYWFGSGTCTMSGPGVQDSGAPPGASAYILNATPAVGGSTGTTVAGSTTFSDPNASFTSSEVGQTIEILNAGKATQGSGYTTPDGLSTTIATVVSPTQVTLATAPQASIAGSAQWDLTSLANNSDGTTTASSTTFTTSGADFSAADVGDTIDVTGAGASGAPLVTNIAAFVSSTQITLGTAASTAVSGNAAWAIYNTTVIGTACTGLQGLSLTAPMIESLSDPVAAVVSGTGPGGAGGDETYLGWSGQNGYSTDVNGTYDAGFVLPFSGPNTTGGCPLLPGPTGLCALAQGEGTNAFYGTDPQGTCPPTQAEANAGLVQCSLAALTATVNGSDYIALALDVAYANDPTPANPTTSISPSTGLSAGQTVTVNACDTCNWWGAGQTGAPGYASPAGTDGVATAIPAPTVFMGSTRASAVPVTNSTVAVTPASYNCGTSGGSALSPPGPVATCILGAVPVTNSSGTVTSGSTTLSDPAGAFNSSIVGDAIAVQGAGASGAALVTTITGVTSASQLTLGTAASTSISGSAVYTYGVSKEGTTGTTTASSSAISCPSTGTIPASCDFTDTNAHFASSDLNKAITIYGAGPAASPLTTSIIKVNSATSVVLAFEASTAIAGTAGYTYGTLLQGSTGTATAASKTFTDSNASFVSGNVGDDIVITGAGTSGASLVTTIAAVNSATSVTLGTAASTSVSGSALYAYGTPTQGTISGSFTVPTGLTCGTSCNVYIDEPDTTLTNGNYSGSGSYNVGLAYNLVNAVEGSTTASCTTGCGGTGPTPPTVTGVTPNNGPQGGTNTVTVTGSGFVSGSTTVDFGTTAGTSVNVAGGGDSLTVVVPAGTGTVSVTVSTTAGGSSTPLANAYTYDAAPTVTGVTPNNGPAAGTNTVTVAGSGFVSGSTSVDFGTNAGTSVNVAGGGASLTVVVPAGTGTVSVTVSTTGGGASTPLASAYTYNALPTVTSVSPNNGPQAGTNTVTVNGTGFVSGSTTVDFGSTAGTSVNVAGGGDSLSVVVPAGTGTVSVTVSTTAGGSSTPLASAYTYNALPTVTSVSPNSGPQAGTNTVTVNGTGFVSGSTTVDFGTNAGTSVNVAGGGASLSVVVPAGTGTVSVTVSTTAGGSSTPLADAYTYNGPPTVTSVTPDNGPQAGTNTVTVNGTGFVSGSTTVDFGTNAGTSVNVAGGGASLSVVVPAGTGTVSVTVSTTAGGSSTPLADAYTYNGPPTVTSVTPDNGPQAGTNTVTVNGTGFVSGSTTVDFGTNAGTSVNVAGGGASLSVVVPAGTGTVSVTVSTTAGGSSTPLASAYTYNALPTVTSVTPNSGPQAGTNTVTVNGTGFVSGSTTVDFGTNAGTSVNVAGGGDSLSVVVPAGTGTVSVTVSTTAGGSSTPLADAYTYNGPPTVTSVTPDNGPQAGTNTVTVNGTGFVSGSTTVDFGTNAGTSVNVAGGGDSLSVVVPAGTGTVSVTVSTTAGGSSTPLADAYTYNGPPTVTSVTPDSGPQAGTNTVTVNGTGFVSGSTTVDFGTNAGTSVNVAGGGDSLSVVVPAGTGTVSVTVSTTAGGSSTPLADAYTYNGPPTVTSVTPNSGPQAGTNTVTVNGTGFVSGSTTVDFGTTAGTSVNVAGGGDSLSVVVPAGTGTVSVTVSTTAGGSSTPLADAYTYNGPPTVTSVTPDNGPQAGTNTVTVNGTGFVSGSTTVDFGTNAGTSVNVAGGGASLSVVVPAGTGTVSVTVSTTAGGSSTPLADAYTYNGPPTVTSVTPDNGPQAGTNTVTVNGTGFVSGSTTVDFGTNAGTSVNVAGGGDSLSVVVPAGTGTVSVTVSTTAGGSSTPLADAYTYNGPPTVTSVTPDNGPQAGTNTVTVNGTGFVSGSTTVDFGTTAGTSVNVAGGGASLSVVVPAGTGTVSVTVSTTAGGSSTPLADAYTYNASTTAGGAITVAKSTGLIGNYPDKISGSGWTHDTSVTLSECASTTYSASTCDTANPVSVTLGTGRYAGIFKNAVIHVAVGTIDTNGDTCGVAGATTCYVVVVGNTADTTSSGALSFTLPNFTLKKTTDVLGNYVDRVKAAGFPAGDTVVAQECDASVSVPGTVPSHCDSSTDISGTAAATGKVVFSPSTGVKLLVGGAYSDTADGTCQLGGSCDIGVTDSDNSAIGLSAVVTFAAPVSATLHETSGVLGNYVDAVKVVNFPIGDTVVAEECDPNLVIPTTIASNCDSSTQTTGTVSARGSVVFSPTGVKLLEGSAYSDSGNGACPVGGSCEVLVSDSDNLSIGTDVAFTFAVPTATAHETANVAANYIDKVTATKFAVGDTVTAQECDGSVTSGTLASHCDPATQISGTVAANGNVTFSATGVKILVGSAYSESGTGSVAAGGTCDIVVNDAANGSYVAIPVGLASAS